MSRGTKRKANTSADGIPQAERTQDDAGDLSADLSALSLEEEGEVAAAELNLPPDELQIVLATDTGDPNVQLNQVVAATAVEAVVREIGLDADDFVSLAEIVEQTDEATKKKADLFLGRTSGSLNARKADLVGALDADDEDQMEALMESVDQSVREFQQQAADALAACLTSENPAEAAYLQSLSGSTVLRASRGLSAYFFFLSTYCKKKKLDGFSLEQLKALPADERSKKIGLLLQHFRTFLQTEYKIKAPAAKRKKAENLEPGSITALCFSLIVALRILGVVDLKRRPAGDLVAFVQERAFATTTGAKVPHFKEAISPVEMVEFIKRTPIKDIAELQMIAYLLLMSETGLRPGSMCGVNQRVNGHPGILLEDVEFGIDEEGEVELRLTVRHEKMATNKLGHRVIPLSSKARHSYFSAPQILLLFVCSAQYTTDSVAECLRKRKVEFRPAVRGFPLFCLMKEKNLLPGSSLATDTRIFDWFSDKTGIPASLVSARSLRKGFATAIADGEMKKNRGLSRKELKGKLLSATSWESRNVQRYYPQNYGQQLAPYRVYGTEMGAEEYAIITSNTVGTIFLSEVWAAARLSEETVVKIEQHFRDKFLRNYAAKTKQNREQQARIFAENKCSKTKWKELPAAPRQLLVKLRKECTALYYSGTSEQVTKSRIAIETIKMKRWREVKQRIKKEEYFRPPKNEYGTLDDQKLKVLEKLFIFGPLIPYSPFNELKNFPQDGALCPQCKPTDANKKFFRTLRELQLHMKDHKATDICYCHDPGCKQKPVKLHSFREHVRGAHGWRPFCLTCKKKVDPPSSKHVNEVKKRNANKKDGQVRVCEIREPWEFEPLLLAGKKCDCTQVCEVSPPFWCVIQTPVVKRITAPSFVSTLQNWKNDDSEAPIVKLAADLLKVPVEKVPACVKSRFS